MKNNPEPTEQPFNYAQTIQSIKQGLKQLESSELSFDQSITLFQELTQKIQQCESFLNTVSLEIHAVNPNIILDDASSPFETNPFNIDND